MDTMQFKLIYERNEGQFIYFVQSMIPRLHSIANKFPGSWYGNGDRLE